MNIGVACREFLSSPSLTSAPMPSRDSSRMGSKARLDGMLHMLCPLAMAPADAEALPLIAEEAHRPTTSPANLAACGAGSLALAAQSRRALILLVAASSCMPWPSVQPVGALMPAARISGASVVAMGRYSAASSDLPTPATVSSVAATANPGRAEGWGGCA